MTDLVVQQTWDRMCDFLRERVGEDTYEKWLQQSCVLGMKRGVLSVGFPNAFIRDWVHEHYGELLDRAATEAFESDVRVAVKVDPQLFLREARQRDAREESDLDDPGTIVRTLEGFLETPGNQAALAALRHVAEGRRPHLNPLVIFGPAGSGKSHLAEAAARHFPANTQVLRLTGEEFAQRFSWSLKTRRIDRWRAECAGADLLILDDIEGLANKAATQREFHQLVQAISAHGGQILVFAAAHPSRLEEMEEITRSLLLSGMLVEIEAPSEEEKVEILSRALRHAMRRIPREILVEITNRVGGSVSRLERLVRKVYAFASLTGREVSEAFLDEHLEEIAGPLDPGRRRTETVFQVVESAFEVEREALLSKRKLKVLSLPRALIVFVLREEARLTFKEIGRVLGGRSHTSVYLMHRKHEDLIRRDPRLSAIAKEAGQRIVGLG